MPVNIDVSNVNQYQAAVYAKASQDDSRLINAVTDGGMMVGEQGFIEIGGVSETVEVTAQDQDTPFTPIPHSRRRIAGKSYAWSERFDPFDSLDLLIDPTSFYVTRGAQAMNRTQDDVFLDAITGNAYEGEAGATVVALPAAQQIAVDYVRSGSPADSNLTVEKLIRAGELLRAAQVWQRGEMYCAVRSGQIGAMLEQAKATSSDYVGAIYSLLSGEINTFLGFRFINCERIPYVSSTTTATVPVWSKSGIVYKANRMPTVEISRRPDKMNAWQALWTMKIGATRAEDVKVVTIACKE